MTAPLDKALAQPEFVDWFRHASPYINAHRGRTFVVLFGGAALQDQGFATLIHDLVLLNSLGVRLVLVHGARPQIEARLAASGQALSYAQGLRRTSAAAMPAVCEAVGAVRTEVEARLSMGLANSPMAGLRMRVVSGNFVTARPLGVRDGVDFGFTGEVRRVDARGIRTGLDSGALVLLSPLGYSPTGETFNLSGEEVAAAAAAALRADKLLFLAEGPPPRTPDGGLIRQLSPTQAQALLAQRQDLPEATRRHLNEALDVCRQGVRRVHLLERERDGALLQELFTREGVGTLVSSDPYEVVRQATIDDVGGILELIRPLEEEGVLVRRSRELLENEIEQFVVLELDGMVIGCAALYPFPEEGMGEVACVAMHPDYQGAGRAGRLLGQVERRARQQGLTCLFVLTTRSSHWFQERGFEPASSDDLPMARRRLYNLQRNSRVYLRTL